FWDPERLTGKDMDDGGTIIGSLLYVIRKGYDGRRLKRERDHITHSELPYFRLKVSWMHILFSMHAVRHNMLIVESNKFDLAIMLQLEYWLERAMDSFDKIGARDLKPHIDSG